MRSFALLAALTLSPAAFADVVDDSSGGSDDTSEPSDSDDKGCATAPILPGVLALGVALAALRRR